MKLRATFAAAAAACALNTVYAGPSDYIYTPEIDHGRAEIDFKFGTARTGSNPRESAASVGYGYGFTDWWFSEVYTKYKRENNERTKWDAIEWENKFKLTEQGQYPVDVGLLLEIERPRDHAEGWEVKWGPLLQKDIGRWQLNGNLLFERSYKSNTPSEAVMQYQWQAKYRYMPKLEFGIQSFGELGRWNKWAVGSQQSHNIGPMVASKIKFDDGSYVKINAAVLKRLSGAAADNTLRMQVEYEF